MNEQKIKQLATAVLKTEASAIEALVAQVNGNFVKACKAILNNRNRIIVTGMGKSGHIAGKIAATLASTGTPAFFIHPGEASHGDLGMIIKGDLILALSNSGETEELLALLPALKRLDITLISITNNPESTLSKESDIALHTNVKKEACPLGLAPTSTTTAALALGDALAIALLESRGFTEKDFALSHPGGSLGRKLLLHVADIMEKNRLPKVSPETSIQEALLEMSKKGLGMTAIVNEQNQVLGVYTDGDLRRTLDQEISIKSTPVSAVMTENCKTIAADILAEKAVQLMEQYQITSLPVVDANKHLLGVIHMHNLLKAGVV